MIESFGETQSGIAVQRVTLSNGNLTAHFLSFGGILQDLRLAGYAPSLVLGFDNFSAYETAGSYIGATAGRFANRIANGHLDIRGQHYQLDRNFLGRHTLHGGHASIGKQQWNIAELNADKVIFAINLPDGHMGFPGNMHIELEWQVKPDDTISAILRAHADAATVCNLAQHSYFNLTGRPDMYGHELAVAAEHYLPVDNEFIPTGEVLSVAETEFDFREPVQLPAQQLLNHNFCLSTERQPIRPVAWLSAKEVGLTLEIRTTEPGLQLYDGSLLSSGVKGLNGFVYKPFSGLALEAQLWPDSPNQPHFPSALLLPDAPYFQQTEFKFIQ